MLFKDYVSWLNQLLKERPELATATAVYAIDEYGENYDTVYHKPEVWLFNPVDYSFLLENRCKKEKPNAVCIN